MALEDLMGLVLVMVRVGCIFAFLPFLGQSTAPRAIKAVIVLALSVVIFPVSGARLPLGGWQPTRFFLYVAAEATLGSLMGVSAYAVFSAIRISGELIGRQMGMGLARMADPVSGVEATPIGNFCELVGVLVLFTMGGHHMMLAALHNSFVQWPLGAFLSADFIKNVAVTAAAQGFLMAVQLAAPLLLLTFMVSLLLAIMARLVPEVNVLILGFPLRIGAGLIGLAIFVPLMVRTSGEVSRAMLQFMWVVSAGG